MSLGKPLPHGFDTPIKVTAWRGWFFNLWKYVTTNLTQPGYLEAYTVATLPAAADYGDGSTFTRMVLVTDDPGSDGYTDPLTGSRPTVCFSDGTNWRRATDSTVIA